MSISFNKFLLNVAVVLTAILAFTSNANAIEFDTFKLDNGLEVIVLPDHRSPVVVNFVWYYAGAADEVDGQTGIAHMLEHLMFKGTKEIPPQEFSKIIARNGGQDNAFTSYDYTGYFQKIAKQNLKIAMKMEADRMRNLSFDNEQFLPERDVIMEERRMRVDSKPINRFYEELQNVHFQKHPYGRPVIGWKRDIESYTRQMSLDWYNTWYVPNNAVLILAGDITTPEAKKLIADTYAKVPSGNFERKKWAIEPKFKEQRRLKKVDEEVTVPTFSLSYRAPSKFSGIAGDNSTTGDALALSLMAELLGGSQTSHLYEKLVKERKLADGASASYHATMRGESSIDISIQPKSNVKLSNIEDIFYKEIENFINKTITKQELTRAKTKLKSIDVYARDNVFVSAYRLGQWIIAGGRPETFDNWLTEIDDIAISDIKRVAKKYLIKQQSSVGYLANSKEAF